MTTSTIRFGVIVALVVVGAVLIAKFPQTGTDVAGATTPPSPSASATGGHTGGTGNTGNGGQTSDTAALEGVKVAVYNGTTQTGLAADVAAALIKRYSVKINSNSIGNAPSIPVDQTAVYFVAPADKAAATSLAEAFFKRLPSPPKVQKLPDNTTAPAGVQVAVYLGTDYVNG